MAKAATFEVTHGEVHLRLNAEEGWLTVNDKDPCLTQGEFQVLKVLAAHAGIPLRQATIISELYAHEADRPKEKIIDVHVCRIRRKFRKIDPTAEELLKSMWGKGYCLMAKAAPQKAA